MGVIRRLLRYAFDPLSLACMAFLAAFSVGYSLFIGAMTSGGTPGAAMRFTLLNFLFGVLSATFSVAIILALSRRLARSERALPPARLGPLFGVAAGIFVINRLVLTIWPIILFSAADVPDDWMVFAFRFPAIPLEILLFPLVVWQVALACGAIQPSFGRVWSEVWRRWAILFLVLIFIAASLGIERFARPFAADASLPRPVALVIAVGPAAIAVVLEYLLAIIVYSDINTREAEVFS